MPALTPVPCKAIANAAAAAVYPRWVQRTGTSLTAAPADIEEFRIVRMLGRGGMGAVYLAHDTILDRAVALKLVRIGTSEESRLRFLTEARALARLDHPNIIGIFRAGTTSSGEPYLVQELVRGTSLDRLSLPLPERRCLELATAIARGLSAAHRQGVLHRDVKPSNIMIDDAGTPRLLDFGLAKLTGGTALSQSEPRMQPVRPVVPPASPAAPPDAASPAGSPCGVAVTAELVPPTADPDPVFAGEPDPTGDPDPTDDLGTADTASRGASRGTPSDAVRDHTSPGALLGTPRYMAPELWRAETATVRSDLYSLGVVMYELLVGEPPFPQGDRASLERAVLDGPPPQPIDQRAQVDPTLAQLAMRCLARDPQQRPESADEVVFQLERIAAGAPPIPDGNPYRGLAPFEAEQRALFFGRGAEISAIINRLRSDSLLVIAGDSGIGKSSLCRAGVLPAITGGALGDRRTCTTRTVTPGRSCTAALDEALGGLPAVADDAALPSALARHLAGPADRGLVVFVDQLEELVTQNDAASAARAAQILAALGARIPGVKLVLAVRGDFLTRVAALPGLREVTTRSLHLVRGLSPDDARDAIESPARAKGVRFETRAMVDALVASVGDRPAALPLLQFALSELWKRRDAEHAVIPARALAEIGGVSGALATHADQVITALAAPERAAARRILLALVTTDGTRASRVRGELVATADDTTATALEALVNGRLVVARDVADGPPVYELAHESLLAAWGTLRGWLDDAAGQRGIRNRLGAAADEWHRLGRRRELLWQRPQLAEAAHLDDLTAGDRAFLRASRRAVRLRTALAVVIAAAIPAAAALTWWSNASRQEAVRNRQVAIKLDEAARDMQTARRTLDQARQAREDASAAFRLAAATPRPVNPDDENHGERERAADKQAEERRSAAEQLWDESGALFGDAYKAMQKATGVLEGALQIGARARDIRRVMAEAIYEQALLASALRDPAADELVERLKSYDDDTYQRRWRAPTEVTIAAGGATAIDLARYESQSDGLRTLVPVSSNPVAQLRTSLAPGSYRAQITAPGIDPVLFPFMVGREPASFEIALPRPGDVPPGFVFIPAGAFLSGEDDQQQPFIIWLRRHYLEAPPLHTETTGSYLIKRDEVTYAEWLAYLRALPPDEREMRRQKSEDTTRSVRLDHGPRRFQLVLRTTSGSTYAAREGEPLTFYDRDPKTEIRWENSPAGGMTIEEAKAYAAWLASTRKVPGARLCTPLEWERGARGADGRRFPHGQRLLPSDANIDATYDKKVAGPDEVGAHPISVSPFGLMDMTGNAFEFTVIGGEDTLRGGNWAMGPLAAVTTNVAPASPGRRESFLGIRLCADLPTEAGRSSR